MTGQDQGLSPENDAPACPCPALDCERQVACRPPAPTCPHPFYSKILDESMAVAVAWDEGRRFGQVHWATNYAPEVPGKEDPNPYRTPPGRPDR